MSLSPEASLPSAPQAARPVCILREVDPSSDQDTAGAAQLHRELFAEIGLIAQLGQRVLQRFYYGRLIKDGLMRAAIAVVDGKPAGLIAFTFDSRAVHRAALGSHFGVALREILVALILTPRILMGIPGATRLLTERRNEQVGNGGPVAEVLALGVREEYRSKEFFRLTGIRLSDSLLYHALKSGRSAGVTEGRGVVLASNRPVLAFARPRASRVTPYGNALEPSIEIWYNLEEALRAMDTRVVQSVSASRATAGTNGVHV